MSQGPTKIQWAASRSRAICAARLAAFAPVSVACTCSSSGSRSARSDATYARRLRPAPSGGAPRRSLHRVDLEEERQLPDEEVEPVTALVEALSLPEEKHERAARAVERSYFVGLTIEETAYAPGVSRATVERDLKVARAFLAQAPNPSDR